MGPDPAFPISPEGSRSEWDPFADLRLLRCVNRSCSRTRHCAKETGEPLEVRKQALWLHYKAARRLCASRAA